MEDNIDNKIPLINAFNSQTTKQNESTNQNQTTIDENELKLKILQDKTQQEKDRIINKYSSKNDSFLNANFFSKLFFCWAFKALKVK